MPEYIYSLTLDVKRADVPFRVVRSIGTESGDLIKVFSHFQLQLAQLLKDLHEEEISELRRISVDDDIPF